jgi:hypothetical protein
MMAANKMIVETSFITRELYPNDMLKHEAIDRLDSIIDKLPKYKKEFETLIVQFKIDDMLYLINTIFRDDDFKSSPYYKLFNEYFDEIEELIHKHTF